ncbi:MULTISPECIES: SIR2 family protein [unclassified Comamonas]|uniref:SIR2 family protein n=1 Tax=unclassified Comamonas TaxID=2638500 RepID=UPI0025C2A498|nr:MULTISPECIES: SIR2 family protein [unclassified Comamonas]
MTQTLSVDAMVRSIGVLKDQPLLVFLGAGASMSSGMPSAVQCIWEWKRSIFLTNNPGLERQFDELSLPSVRQRIQRWLDAQQRFPKEGAPDEYSVFIEECYTRGDDRRRYFQEWVKASNPGLGYQLLAELARRNSVSSVWTTNFDSLVARAATAHGVTTIEIGQDSKERVTRPLALGELQCVSMHGDYRYDPLKNTQRELAEQEAELRATLIPLLKSHPVLVCGYSGRDTSVMEAFLEAYQDPKQQRLPLFWTQYGDAAATGDVARLLETPGNLEPQRFLVPGVTFDDLMRRIALHVTPPDDRHRVDTILDRFKESPTTQRAAFSLPNLPVSGLVKSNAFPMHPPGELLEFDLTRWPARGTVWAELRALGEAHGFVAAPFRGKVYALASPQQIQRAFVGNLASEVKRVPLNDEDLRYEDGTANSLMRRATALALAARAGLPCDHEGLIWDPSNSNKHWVERREWIAYWAVILQVKTVSGSLALVLKPTLFVTDAKGNEAPRIVVNAVKIKVLGYQHNAQFNEALEFWRGKLLPEHETVLRFPDVNEGVKFSVSARPFFAKITDERDASVRLSYKHERLASQVGLQIAEPRLSFLPKSGRGTAFDTHPIRGLMQDRPFDALLTDTGIATKIRAALISPARDGRRVSEYLGKLQEPVDPTRSDEDYLLAFPGFSNAFKCGLEVTQPGGKGFVGLDEPTDWTTASARELGARIAAAVSSLKAAANPSVIFIFIPSRWSALRGYDVEGEKFDLHDFVKASAIPQGVATQFLEEDTLTHPQQCRVRWWLSLATYAKAMRSPWALDGLDKDSAYVGVGYSLRHRPGEDGNVILGCSHLYSPNGLGLQFRLSKIENPIMRRKNPFMSFDDARRLGEGIRELFFEANLRLPKRVVIHKQTPFLKEEREGLQAGLEGVECVELLQIHIDDTLRYVASKADRKGALQIDGYPIHRGTTIVVDDATALLWVHGASTALRANRAYYQGKRRIPAPLVLTRHAGTSDLMTLAAEILGLSKMNFNSFDLYGQLPATIETSRRVARIGALLDRYSDRSYDYRLFM